jgi:hypothetical protein
LAGLNGRSLGQQWQAYHQDEQRMSDSLHGRLSLVQRVHPKCNTGIVKSRVNPSSWQMLSKK